MDLKEYLKEGSLAVLVIVSALYLTGTEFYISLFHDLGTGVFFFVPMEYTLYEGFAPIRAVGVILVLCATLGYLSTLCRDSSIQQLRNWRYALAAGPVLLAWHMPFLAKKFLDVPALSQGISVACWKLSLSCWGLFSCLATFLLLANPPKLPGMRRFAYFWVLFASFSWAYYFSSLIGHTFALEIHQKQKAVISFSDESMQKEYAGSFFHPVMEKGDEIVLLRLPISDKPQGGHDAPFKLVFVKQSFIKKMDLQ